MLLLLLNTKATNLGIALTTITLKFLQSDLQQHIFHPIEKKTAFISSDAQGAITSNQN